MHLDDEQVQRLLHGELALPVAAPVRAHVSACGVCRTRVDAAAAEERDVSALLGRLDHRLPDVHAGSVIEKARYQRRGALRWAAGMLLAIGLAGAAYAAPGSPVRGWLERLVRGPAETRALTPPPREPIVTPSLGGIAVAPGDELIIAFDTTARGGKVRISLTDGADVVIRAPAGTAVYTAREAGVLVTPSLDSTIYEVEVPRAAARVEIRVGQERKFLKNGSNVSGMPGFVLRPM